MSAHDWVVVTFALYGIRFGSKTQSGLSLPARHWATASIGLLTVESTCLPTSCTATSPAPLKGIYVNLIPAFCSIAAVMIWSSCLEPVPAILKRLSWSPLLDFASLMKSLLVLYGVSALTHSTNWSSAIIWTGVISRQLNGTPVASGVVKRLDSVM